MVFLWDKQNGWGRDLTSQLMTSRLHTLLISFGSFLGGLSYTPLSQTESVSRPLTPPTVVDTFFYRIKCPVACLMDLSRTGSSPLICRDLTRIEDSVDCLEFTFLTFPFLVKIHYTVVRSFSGSYKYSYVFICRELLHFKDHKL